MSHGYPVCRGGGDIIFWSDTICTSAVGGGLKHVLGDSHQRSKATTGARIMVLFNQRGGTLMGDHHNGAFHL